MKRINGSTIVREIDGKWSVWMYSLNGKLGWRACDNFATAVALARHIYKGVTIVW